MLTEQIIKNGIRNIKTNLSILIDVEDVPFIIDIWQRNFGNWNEYEFKKVIEYFIDNADWDTKFPRPYELKKIYFEIIEERKIQKRRQEKWEKEQQEKRAMPEELKEQWGKLIKESKKDGKI